MSYASRSRRTSGFTMVELITVLIVVGILGAIGASRFFDNTVFESRAAADQAKGIIRYAQKLAIARNTFIFVRVNGNSFAVCSAGGCGAGTQIAAPGGGNSGSTATRANCQVNGTFVANWMCEGVPAGVNVNLGGLNGGFFYFDALGRPYTAADPAVQGTQSTFVARTTLTFTSGANVSQMVIWPETGYVQ